MPELKRFPLTPGHYLSAPPEAAALIEDIWNRDRYFLHAGIAAGDIVLDIGANVGVFALLAAVKGATVFCFEPNPEAFAILESNIRANGFSDRIRAFNLAVSGTAGTLELSVPDSGKIYSLGSATTSASGREQLGGIPEVRMRTFPVRCTTLDSIVADLVGPERPVRFLKIDCEGAEWDILRSLEGRRGPVPLHIAMETHLGYLEKDMADLLRKLGYAITGFAKRSGRFQTGYLYASAREGSAVPNASAGVAAILSAPAFLMEGRELQAGSGESFRHAGGEEPLERAWEVDGAAAGNGPDLRLPGLRAGVHSVSLCVRSGRSQDCAVRRVAVLEPDYFLGGAEVVRLDADAKAKIRLAGKADFRIPADALPGTWEIGGVVVGITPPPQAAAGSGTLVLAFNGKAFAVGRDYAEIRLDFPAREVEVRFSLLREGAEEVEVAWWPVGAEEADAPASGPVELRSDEGRVELPTAGIPGLIRFSGARVFRIAGDLLPAEWTPKAIKVGIAAVSSGPANPPLAGRLEQGGQGHALDGWYREVALAGGGDRSGVEFTLSLPGEAGLKIAWWAE